MKFTETELEQAIIEFFQTHQNYQYINGDELERTYEQVILEDDLRTYIANNYPNEQLTTTETENIVNKIKYINSSPLYLGNKQAFWLINEGFDLIREDSSQVALHVDYINFDNVEKNIFKVVNQFSVQGEKLRRPDLLLFINGIPIAIFEFKSAIREEATIFDAWQQIHKRYNRDIPNLMKYCFLSVISDGANSKMGSIFTPYAYYYSWNKANDTESVANGIGSLQTLLKGAFAQERVLAILRDFIFYPDDDNNGNELAIVCRYPQFFGATKMLANIKQHLKHPDNGDMGDGKGGIYFGATGCGKTYTMLFLTRLLALRDNETFNNPTILLITDREDLDTQVSELFVTASRYLHEEDVRSIESRADLKTTLKDRASGGVYITTIQKFCENTDILSPRNNIICISDEAHRTQTSTGSKLKQTDKGVFTSYGFGYYLRQSFPNATYCGFTGTPIDETLAVFGGVVEQYTMKESSDDGITVKIQYEPRLARVILSEEQLNKIQQYYDDCALDGANSEQIAESQKAMSSMKTILSNPDRVDKLAKDIIKHYQALCTEKPNIVQKAMIVCSDRKIAFQVLQAITAIKPEWGECKKADTEIENTLSKEELNKLVALPKINLVATQGNNDDKDLYDACGSKSYRQMLDKQFKNNNSNFKIAVVVDMWITGFDVPSLAVMYIDKPLQKHTLIQTISRVNRVFEGKTQGLVVDYIGFKNDMLEAVKRYAGEQTGTIEELATTLKIFRNHLQLIKELLIDFDDKDFYQGSPLARLNCLNMATEFIQVSKELQTRFMHLSKLLKNAYNICYPSAELTEEENATAQFYLAIRSLIYKQTKGDAPDAEIMNQHVEKMILDAIACTGVENIINTEKSIDLFSDEFIAELENIELPISKFNALLTLLKQAIKEYGKTNKVKSLEFNKRMKEVVEKYNSRDNLAFTSEVVEDFINGLSDEIVDILGALQKDKNSFDKLGISYQEKAFYDILINVRDTHNFVYADDKCLVLAKKIKELVEDKTKFANWSSRSDIKNQLNMDLTVLLYKNGYPPEWDEEVFEKVMEQAENFKKNNV
ncbi:MAG: type I restriction endonuclease subunit R [Moraxellaceae bacterium]|nr:type I restriction endonuclease subunit R [Moraxellaceae bacterium]